MSNDIAFSASMDAANVEKAYQKLAKENQMLREEMMRISKESREAAKKDQEYKKLQSEASKKLIADQERLAAAGRKLTEQNRTAFEKYKVEKQEAQKLLQAGTISEETYRRQLTQLAQKYKDITPQAQARAKALKDESAAAKQAALDVRALADAGKNSAAESGGMIAGWKGAATAMGVAGGAALGLIKTLNSLKDAQRDAVAAAGDETATVDTLARKLQIQNSLTDPERQAMSRSVLKQSLKSGTTADEGFRAATQLVSSGFVDPIQSGTVGTVLDVKQATNFTGSPEDLIKGIAQTLNAYGMERTNENARSLGMSVQSLFKGTDLQLTDLQDFAKNAAVFKGANLPVDQSLAGFTALREVLPAGEAGTGLRNFTTILQGAGATKSASDALGSMGLKPQDVDFVGEDLVQVLTKLKEATQGMAEEDRNTSMIKLFGRENFAGASLLMNNPQRIAELQRVQQDTGQFEADVAVARGGMQADRNRVQLQTQLSQLDRAESTHAADIRFKREDALLKDDKERAYTEGAFKGTAVAAAQMLRWTPGFRRATPSLDSAADDLDEAPRTIQEQIRERARQQSRDNRRNRSELQTGTADPEMEKQTSLLEQQTKLLQRLVQDRGLERQAGVAARQRLKQGENGP